MEPHFFWVPYFEGKLLNYYQYFALVGSTVVTLIALLNYIIYVQLNSCSKSRQPISASSGRATPKIITILESFFYQATFVLLSLVPLICSSLDAINTGFGIIGMMIILSAMVILNNRRLLRNQDGNNQHSYQAVDARRRITDKKALKKKLIIVAIISILLPLLGHRTCLCFYNDEIGYYNYTLGYGINTMATRFFQLKRACPPGPPCHLYATLPEDSITSVFINLHTHKGVSNVTVHYQ
jgi:hypothetical protein